MSMITHRLAASMLMILFVTIPSSCDESRLIRSGTSQMRIVGQSVSGVWEKVGTPERKDGTIREFSWGKAVVFPNAGLIIDVGAEKPFVQFWGEQLQITAIRTNAAGRYEFDVRDTAITGSGAFVKVLFAPNADGTAVIDFQRQDGTFFGAATYERRYGPQPER